MTNSAKYVAYGAGGLVLFLVIQKLRAPTTQQPSAGSLSGLVGGSIPDALGRVWRGVAGIFGGNPSSSPGGSNAGSTWGDIPSPAPGAKLDFNANLQPQGNSIWSSIGPVASGETYGGWLDEGYGDFG